MELIGPSPPVSVQIGAFTARDETACARGFKMLRTHLVVK